MLITTLQLTQMVFGIAVTVSSVIYLAQVRASRGGPHRALGIAEHGPIQSASCSCPPRDYRGKPIPIAAYGAGLTGPQGRPCYVSLFNSFMGLAMYASYFVLFLQLFLSHYVYNKTGPRTGKTKAEPPVIESCPPSAVAAAADGAAKARPVGKAGVKQQ